jgi:hypothetical protein
MRPPRKTPIPPGLAILQGEFERKEFGVAGEMIIGKLPGHRRRCHRSRS